MVEKEGTNEGSLDGMVKSVTNSLAGGAMKMFDVDGRHFLKLLHKSVRPAQREQLSYNVRGKGEEVET